MLVLSLQEVLIFATIFTTTVLFSTKLAWIFKYLLNVRRQIKLIAETGISGPTAYPIVGNLIQMHNNKHGDPYYRINRLFQDSNPINRLWIGPVLVCCIKDPRDIELVLNGPTFSEKPHLYKIAECFLGGSLNLLDTQTWKRHRKAMMPSFHLNILQNFVETFSMTGKRFAEDLENLAEKKEIADVTPLCGRYANETVCRTILSSNVDELEIPDFPRLINSGMEIVLYRLMRPWYMNEWLFSWSSKFAKYMEIKDSFEHFTKDLIKTKKQEISTSTDRKGLRKLAFLDCMLMSTEGSALTDEELFCEVRTLLLAGTETTMESLSIIMYTLAVEQEIQDKVYEELRDIFGEDQDRPVTHEDLPHMDYLERVIKEMLRIFAVLPYYGRSCSEDTKMPSGDTIPKGATAFLWLPYTHMDAANFPNPKVFDPDRFLPEVSRTRHPYSYIPFSAGPKFCIGQRYSMFFMKTVLATILRRVRIVLPEGGPKTIADIPLSMTFSISIAGGARLKFERRTLS